MKRLCLVVDDEPAVIRLLSAVLDDAGFQTITANNGLEGMTAVEQYADDLHVLICDIQMPRGMEGLELARRVRQQFPGVPILLMSGDSGATGSGFDFLPKPFTTERLIGTIQRIAR